MIRVMIMESDGLGFEPESLRGFDQFHPPSCPIQPLPKALSELTSAVESVDK